MAACRNWGAWGVDFWVFVIGASIGMGVWYISSWWVGKGWVARERDKLATDILDGKLGRKMHKPKITSDEDQTY